MFIIRTYSLMTNYNLQNSFFFLFIMYIILIDKFSRCYFFYFFFPIAVPILYQLWLKPPGGYHGDIWSTLWVPPEIGHIIYMVILKSTIQYLKGYTFFCLLKSRTSPVWLVYRHGNSEVNDTRRYYALYVLK